MLGRPYEMRGPIGNNFSRPRFPVNMHQGLYLYVLDKPRVDYTLARGPLMRGAPLCAGLPYAHDPIGNKPRVDYTLARGPLMRGAPLCAGPNWEQFQSAQVPSQHAPRSVLVCTRQAESRLHSSAGPPYARGPIGSNWSNWFRAGPA